MKAGPPPPTSNVPTPPSPFYILSYYIAGVEIEDILQSGFDGEEGYTLSPISTGSTQSRLNKTKVRIIILF